MDPVSSGPQISLVQTTGPSALALASLMVREWRRVAGCAVVGGLLAAALVLPRHRTYRATASFIPQGNDAASSRLASLAGQFGVTLPAPNQSQSFTPDFYVRIITSREILDRLLHDTVSVPELSPRPIELIRLLKIDSASPAVRDELAVRALQSEISASAVKTTGAVDIAVSSRWPSASFGIVQLLLRELNDFNFRTRQSQATAERQFVESQLNEAQVGLRAAEDRLEQFLSSNRQMGSPELTFQRDRLQRAVNLAQQIFTSLTQSYEDARIREIRNTPAIMIVETPVLPALPEPRGLVSRVVLGTVVGGILGMFIVVLVDQLAFRRATGDEAATELWRAAQRFRAALRLSRNRDRATA